MSSTHNPGRVAGLWYLLLIAIGPLFLIYIPAKLFVHGNAAATVKNIAAHERLFRFGILAELVGGFILPLADILAPQYQDKLFVIFQPAFLGEIALTLWLVIKGAKPPPLNAPAALAIAD